MDDRAIQRRRAARPERPGGALTSIDLGIRGIGEATPVGRGGFGVVYRAHQDAVGRTVAVKVLSVPTLGEDERRRFNRECQALGALSGHPNIVAVFDSGTSREQRPYLIMDYLPGGTLAERLSREGPIAWKAAADLGVKLAGALAAAHAAGLLHRDVKPGNILISAYGEPQLVDFGIARLVGGSQSRTGDLTATLAHAAPEVLAGHRATGASDIYSLASTLYELLNGNAPFVRSTDETIHPLIARAQSEEPPDLRAAGLPDAMWQPLSAALAKAPDDRPASARAFAEALQHAQRTLGAATTALVLPSLGDSHLAGALDADKAGEWAPTVVRVRRQRDAPLEPDTPARQPRRRHWLLVIGGVLAAGLVVAAGAVGLDASGHRRASKKIASTVGTVVPASAGRKPQAAPSPDSGHPVASSRRAPVRTPAPAATRGPTTQLAVTTGGDALPASAPPRSPSAPAVSGAHKPKAPDRGVPVPGTPTTSQTPPTLPPVVPTANAPMPPPATTPAPAPPAPASSPVQTVAIPPVKPPVKPPVQPPAKLPVTPPAAKPPTTFAEQESPNYPVNTFTNYHNASGRGQAIAKGQLVRVSCKVYDPTIQSVKPDGYWYRIASSPWNNLYYSPANTFLNGDPVGGPYSRNTDLKVPNC